MSPITVTLPAWTWLAISIWVCLAIFNEILKGLLWWLQRKVAKLGKQE